MSTTDRITQLEQRKGELERLAELEKVVSALEYRLLAAPDQAVIRHVIDAVSKAFGVPRIAIGSRERTAKVAMARQACFWVCCKAMGMGYSEMGRLFQRDHGTVMHGCRTIQAGMDTNERFKARMEAVLKAVKSNYEQPLCNTDK